MKESAGMSQCQKMRRNREKEQRQTRSSVPGVSPKPYTANSREEREMGGVLTERLGDWNFAAKEMGREFN